MSKRSSPENSIVEFRFSHVWDDEIIPIERYFTASSAEEAIDMFAYTCLKTGRKPILQEFASWNRWGQTWDNLPIPEREEYVIGEDALTLPSPEESPCEENPQSQEKALREP